MLRNIISAQAPKHLPVLKVPVKNDRIFFKIRIFELTWRLKGVNLFCGRDCLTFIVGVEVERNFGLKIDHALKVVRWVEYLFAVFSWVHPTPWNMKVGDTPEPPAPFATSQEHSLLWSLGAACVRKPFLSFNQFEEQCMSYLWRDRSRAFGFARVRHVSEDPQMNGSIESGKKEKLSL